MRSFILFHMVFFVGGLLLCVGAFALTMMVGEWAQKLLGEDSRLARALWYLAGLVSFGGVIALAVYVYYHLGLMVWAEAGRYWHYQGLFWQRIWKDLFG